MLTSHPDRPKPENVRLSTRHVRRSERRLAPLWIAALVAFGHLSAVFHFASTEHVLCFGHGAFEHVGEVRHGADCDGDGAAEVESGHHAAHHDPAEKRPGHTPPSGEHEGCDLALAAPSADRPSVDAPALIPAVAVATIEPAAGVRLPCHVRRYLLAPKTSPPLVG